MSEKLMLHPYSFFLLNLVVVVLIDLVLIISDKALTVGAQQVAIEG
jgi:hypothetical protein